MSPEDQRVWEEDAESEYAEAHASALPAPHSPADTERVPQGGGEVDRARVARYAEAMHASTCDVTRKPPCPVDGYLAWRRWAEAAVTVADKERAALVAEVERLRESLTELAPSDLVEVEGSLFQRADLPRILGNFMRSSVEYGREAKESCLRAESAEAEVARLCAESVESSSLYAQWRDDCAAEVERLRVRLAKVGRGLDLLIETVESECDADDPVCHDHDRTDDGRCALLADLTDLRAALADAPAECGAEHPTNPTAVPCIRDAGHEGSHMSTTGCGGSVMHWHDAPAEQTKGGE